MKFLLILFLTSSYARILKKISVLDKIKASEKDDVPFPIVKEYMKSREIDERTRKELLRPITHSNFHNPNIPLYEPYQLSESQQDILLSH
ncbi:hypothetical protein G9O61_00g020560 [Vairimorpha ceranae]|nr:hypothetical protein G9O61_00g020560 [Vairimorpha ceranae]